MRYLASTDDDPSATLVDAINALADHLTAHHEERRASVVSGSLVGEPDRLPQRFLGLFTRGMGGLLDEPLRSGGRYDPDATEMRDRLADIAYQRARTMLGDEEIRR